MGGQATMSGRRWRRLGRQGALYAALGLLAAVTLWPFYAMAVASITPREHIFSVPPVYVPRPTLDNFVTLVRQLPFAAYLRNSLLFAIGSALLSVVTAFLAAYGFVRFPVPGSGALLVTLIASMGLPEIVTVIPLYLVLNELHLINTVAGLVLVMGSVLAPFTVWALVSFIQQVPREMEEAAVIDGASLPELLARVVIPVLRPSLATLLVINLISSWNYLLYPLVFTASPRAKTLTVAITEVFQARTPYGRPWELISALGMVMVVPMVLLVFTAERAIVSGLTRGSVK